MKCEDATRRPGGQMRKYGLLNSLFRLIARHRGRLYSGD
jgi:hypothetical protein